MRRVLKAVGVLLGCLVLVAVAGLGYLFVAYPKVGPAGDVRVEGTPERIARGQYLANHVSVCTDCHSQRDYTKYAGPIRPESFGAGGEVWDESIGFPGRVVSRNLTPAGLGTWTDGEILRAFTEGVSRDGTPLFELMPYTTYGRHMAREDAQAIVAYLRTLPTRQVTLPERHLNFPLPLVVRTMPVAASQPATAPKPSDGRAYGEYLTRIAACADCHTPRDESMALRTDRHLSGGQEFIMPNGLIARSANLTPDATGLRGWTRETFVARFRAFRDGAGYVPVASSDFNTPMPWGPYSGMSDDDLNAIFDYLQSVPAIANTVEKVGRRAADE
ncbi:MAG TPA: c-type cytochrome [Luteitalea sp.]|nr:c-type cytochrome [Luteitalea sp.]